MPAYIIRKCPKCDHTLEIAKDYIAVDNPIEECNNCGTLIRNTNINEWYQLNIFKKIYYILITCWTGVFYGSGLGIVTTLIMYHIYEINDNNLFIQIILTSALSIMVLYLVLFYYRIKESNKRSKSEFEN